MGEADGGSQRKERPTGRSEYVSSHRQFWYWVFTGLLCPSKASVEAPVSKDTYQPIGLINR